MKRRICDFIIGQVVMAFMLVIIGIAYEGIGYSDFDDILPYIQIALIQLVFSIPFGVSIFFTAVNGLEYLKTKKETKEVVTEVEQA